jgi:hypothetical protein
LDGSGRLGQNGAVPGLEIDRIDRDFAEAVNRSAAENEDWSRSTWAMIAEMRSE